MAREELTAAVEVGWNCGIQPRWFLTRKGALRASDIFFHGDVPWQTTEPGLQSLLPQLPAIEPTYKAVHAVHQDREFQELQFGGQHQEIGALAMGHAMLGNFEWVWGGHPLAVAQYNDDSRIPIVYVDHQVTATDFANLDRRRLSGLRTAEGDLTGRDLRPPYWLVVCDGAVSTITAKAYLWRNDAAIFLNTGGYGPERIDRSKRIEPTGLLKVPQKGPTTLGKPENIVEWVQDEACMLIYRDRIAARLFSLAEDVRLARPTDAVDLWKYSGKVVKNTVGHLIDARMCTNDSTGGFTSRLGRVAGHLAPCGHPPSGHLGQVRGVGSRQSNPEQRSAPPQAKLGPNPPAVVPMRSRRGTGLPVALAFGRRRPKIRRRTGLYRWR